MDVQKLQDLASGSESLLRTLSYGFFRSESAEDLASALAKAPFTKPFNNWMFRCFREKASDFQLGELARHFLAMLANERDHKKQRVLAVYLDRLYDDCGVGIKAEIAKALLKSGRRYLRKYAYAKKLDDISEDVVQLAYNCITQYPDEAVFLLRTVADSYENAHVQAKFDEILQNYALEDRQVKKLFLRKTQLLNRHWDWLEQNHPSSIIYLAAHRMHELSDAKCLSLSRSVVKQKLEYLAQLQRPAPTFGYREIQPLSLLMWCLARMGKWAVIRELLKNPDTRKAL